MCNSSDEAAYKRVLRRVERRRLRFACSTAISCELQSAHEWLEEAQSSLRALRELKSAQRYLNERKRLGNRVKTTEQRLEWKKELQVVKEMAEEAVRRAGRGVQDVKERKSCANKLIAIEKKADAKAPHRKCKPSESSLKRQRPAINNLLMQEPRDSIELAKMDSATSTIARVNTSPVELNSLSRGDSPGSDSDTESEEIAPPPLLTCLEAAKTLELGSAAFQQNQFPALALRLLSQVRESSQEIRAPNRAEEFAQAFAIIIRVGIKLQPLPTVRFGLANLLLALDHFEQLVHTLPQHLGENASKLSRHFLGITKPEALGYIGAN